MRDRVLTPASPRAGTALCALAAAALLAGCMNMIPAYQRPAAPVPAAYAPEMAPAGGANVPAAADLEWQRFFGDARLRRLIELSLANNRDLRVAVLNIEQARAAYRIKRADELPTVGAGLTVQREPNYLGQATNSYAAGLQVTNFELDFFGRVHSLSQAALAQYLATEEARKTVQISLIASVATTYVAMVSDDELLAVTRDTLKTREDGLNLTKLKFDHGASSELDFRQAEQLLESARATLAQARRQRMQDENALVLLLGQSLPTDLPSGLPLDGQRVEAELPAGLPSDLLTRRPDVRSAEQQLRSANANIGAARAAFFPRISLTASAGSASGELSGLFKSGTFAFTGSATLLQPIFDYGRNSASLDVAKVNRDIAVAQYEKAIQSAFREVADGLAGRATLGEQLRAQVAQVHATQIAADLADLRYKNGATSYLEVLDAQRSLFAAKQAMIGVQALQSQNLMTLYKALGGGWTEPAAATTAAN